MRYSHMYTVAFTVESKHERGEDVTPEMLRSALDRRILDLDRSKDWLEAVGMPDDTYQLDEDTE